MQTKDAMKQVVESAHMLTQMYVQDLQDAELLERSVPGTNHIAWQLGHNISETAELIEMLGQPAPALPEGFSQAHSKQRVTSDNPADFSSKAVYLDLLSRVKAASLAAIDATPDSELDDPAPEAVREYAPTKGAMLLLLGTHLLMHVGQFVPIRRKLGKPPLF